MNAAPITPPPNSELKIAVAGNQVYLHLTFLNPVTNETRNYALLFTEAWNRFMAQVSAAEALVVSTHLEQEIEEKGIFPTFEAEVASCIASGQLDQATELLDALLQDVHEQQDAFAIEGLRVHSALWQQLQTAKKAAASRN